MLILGSLYTATAYIYCTVRCGIRILSVMVWSQGGADYTASLFLSTITGVVVQGFRSSSVPVTHKGYLVESCIPLWFGSSQANRSVFNTLSRCHSGSDPPENPIRAGSDMLAVSILPQRIRSGVSTVPYGSYCLHLIVNDVISVNMKIG